MTAQTKPTTIDIGEVSNARELVFCAAGEDPATTDRRYILQVDGADYLATIQRYAKYQIKRTSEYYIDDSYGQWYYFSNVDCFDPPIAIIRARSFESAYECFCDEYSRWMAVDERDAADYPEDEREYSASGVHIDASGVQGYALQLLSVSLEVTR